jgi:V8-like Glu-specific endopeptidase
MTRIHKYIRLIERAGILSSVACAALLAPLGVVRAQTADAAVRAYWTPERLRDAIPMDKHPANPGPDGRPSPSAAQPAIPGAQPLTSGPDRVAVARLPESAAGAAPQTAFVGGETRLYKREDSSPHAAITPDASADGYLFTTFRIFPDSGSNAEVKNYPYTAVGHLFFTITKSGGVDKPGNYQCTASVIKDRIIATAGHCVGSPQTSTGGHFSAYGNWLFIPADMNGTAPFGSWTTFAWGVSSAWANGNGDVPNSEDWGFLDVSDQGSPAKKIGKVTGYLGYSTKSLSANNVTVLGYPANLDNASYMQQNNGTTGGSADDNTWAIGSAMGGGASGGPWIVNFGQAPSCAGTCLSSGSGSLGSNTLVAVTSYGPSNAVGYLGASQFNSDWTSLLTTMCGKKSGSC